MIEHAFDVGSYRIMLKASPEIREESMPCIGTTEIAGESILESGCIERLESLIKGNPVGFGKLVSFAGAEAPLKFLWAHGDHENSGWVYSSGGEVYEHPVETELEKGIPTIILVCNPENKGKITRTDVPVMYPTCDISKADFRFPENMELVLPHEVAMDDAYDAAKGFISAAREFHLGRFNRLGRRLGYEKILKPRHEQIERIVDKAFGR